MKNCHEVRSKTCLNLGKISVRYVSSWACIHKIISWDPRISRRNYVKQSCRFHGDLQLSCWKFPLNHLASWWKFGTKLRKNKNISILWKISKLRNFNFSKQNLESLIYWWTSFTFCHVLMNYDLWHLILTKKSKFDFSVYSWLLISWLKNSSVNPMDSQCLESCY